MRIVCNKQSECKRKKCFFFSFPSEKRLSKPYIIYNSRISNSQATVQPKSRKSEGKLKKQGKKYHHLQELLYLCIRLEIARKGRRVNILWQKGRYETFSSTWESRKFKVQEETQPKRPLWVYCTLSAAGVADGFNMSRRGLSRVAYPCTRQCESPHVG